MPDDQKSKIFLACSPSKSTSAFCIRNKPETMIEVAPKFIGESGISKKIQDFLYISIEVFDPKYGESPPLELDFDHFPRSD